MTARTQVRLRPRPDIDYVSNGRTVLATGRNGFLEDFPEQGLFVHETRLLSRYRYGFEGLPLLPVSLSNVEQQSWLGYYAAPHPGYRSDLGSDSPLVEVAQQAIELRLSRYVGEGLHEDIDVTNFTQQPADLVLILELDSDFADQNATHRKARQFHVTSQWSEHDTMREWRADCHVKHRYAHQGHRGVARMHRGVAVRFFRCSSPPMWDGKQVRFQIPLKPHATWHACVDHIPIIDGEERTLHYRCRSFRREENEYDRRRNIFLTEATDFSSRESGTLAPVVIGALEQSKQDLAALRLYDLDRDERAWVPAAGLPMYVALFGRDMLTTAWEMAPVTTGAMRGTLSVLAELQGTETDNWRDEQPGRMLHEVHTGPIATLNYTPQGRDYGSVTTSDFYPFVVAQLWHWTGDKSQVQPFIEPAIAALKWLEECRDQDNHAFCKYQTRSVQGVENQGWKDSGDAIVYEDGSQVPKPIATCEEQGIRYAAKMNFAEVLWWFDRKDEAKQLYREATELKKRFNEAFWMEDESFFAMALDPDDRQVRSIGSNALHCVATGIADKDLVPRTLERLFAPDMFSGWGVRTLSAKHPSYNPYAYHRGTVWPVEHGPFGVGAYRYGCHDYVERICAAQFELASLFDFYRLPECVAGHPRDDEHPFPAIYPAANSPQAWSATTVYTLLQAMLGLQPFAPLRTLFLDPYLPEWLPELTISSMRVADATVSIRFFRQGDGSSDYEILDTKGAIHVIRQPSPWSFTATLGERAGDLLTSLVH
jgi:glycogen debranching enzyme